ncbi:hypothetical protein PDE01_25430 [Paracoccus denitrificans]|nr:hypothetical protein PDE01_25430 [Paracoccus denitrificans]
MLALQALAGGGLFRDGAGHSNAAAPCRRMETVPKVRNDAADRAADHRRRGDDNGVVDLNDFAGPAVVRVWLDLSKLLELQLFGP